MSKTIFITGILLLSTPLIAECKAGLQRAKVIKVLAQGLASGGSARIPEPADEGSAEKTAPTKKIRAVILDYAGKKYELRIPAGSEMENVTLAPGQEVCVVEKGGVIHVSTVEGTPLPGVAHPFTKTPSTASPGNKSTKKTQQ